MKNHTVLAINDNSDQLELLAFILGESGYRVLLAKSGIEGMKIARRESPDFIISNELLPEMNGIRLRRQVGNKKTMRLIPFLLIGALCKDTKNVVYGPANGTNDYIGTSYQPLHLEAFQTAETSAGETSGRLF